MKEFDTPLVSVVIPAYNEEKYISRCIETLLAQSYDNIEIIVVDDGSTDKTKDIVKRFPVKLLEQDHKGSGAARNLGSKESIGEILLFLDSDMEFDKNYIYELIQPIVNENEIGTCHFGEKCANLENILAKFQGSPQLEYDDGIDEVFRAIRKDKFIEVNGFDLDRDYSDDRSLFEKIGQSPARVYEAVCYHHNAETLQEIYEQYRWRHSSYLKENGIKLKFMLLTLSNILLLIFFTILLIMNITLGLSLLILFLTIVGIIGAIRFMDLRAVLYYPLYIFTQVLAAFSALYRYIFSKNTLGK